MQPNNEDIIDIKDAISLLENVSLTSRMIDVLGSPIEKGLEKLPEKLNQKIYAISEKAIKYALNTAIVTLNTKHKNEKSSDKMHKIFVAASGGIGGAFGLSTLPVELPVSTTIMLRSIADIARSEGEDIESIETRLSCLEVFALGGDDKFSNSFNNENIETRYYYLRTILSSAISEAAAYIVKRSIFEDTSPIILRLIETIAIRFGIVVSEKAAATAIPVIGAAGGAIVNALFMDHYQELARGHFIIRRLERIYGKDIIKDTYINLLKELD